MRSFMTILTGTVFLAGAAIAASAATYEVIIEDLIDPPGPAMGQPLTPPVVVTHGAGYSMFSAGSVATPGLVALAEDGMTAILAGEATADPDVEAVAVGGGPFFDSVAVMISGTPGNRLSLATMLARTNDLFTGVHDLLLPAEGEIFVDTNAYDAGSEVNSGLIADIPFYGNVGVGEDEGFPVTMIGSYTVFDDPDHGELSWSFPPTARITVRIVDPTATAETTWGAVRGLFR